MTEEIFRQDAYLERCEARVTSVDDAGIHLDRTVFYPMGGGQPGDSGVLRLQDGSEIRISDTRKDGASGDIVHIPEGDLATDLAGKQVEACIDWERRHRLILRRPRWPLPSIPFPRLEKVSPPDHGAPEQRLAAR